MSSHISQRKQIIRTRLPLGRTGSDYIALVRIVGLEPTRRWHRNLNPARLPIPSYPQILLFLHGGATRGWAHSRINGIILSRHIALVNAGDSALHKNISKSCILTDWIFKNSFRIHAAGGQMCIICRNSLQNSLFLVILPIVFSPNPEYYITVMQETVFHLAKF